MTGIVVTIDLDWAPQPAIEETLDFLDRHKIKPTLFVTHRSPVIEERMAELEVGLHPYFSPDSSHGTTIAEVVEHVMAFPHNFSGFRNHRFSVCNASYQAMFQAGMTLSSNVCTDLEALPPFKNRFGFLEVPIFLEDGGFLWQQHPLEITKTLKMKMENTSPKVILIHPMHFALNTPYFDYMTRIKHSVNREQWRYMDKQSLESLRWKGRGIRDFLSDLIAYSSSTCSLGQLAFEASKGSNQKTTGLRLQN